MEEQTIGTFKAKINIFPIATLWMSSKWNLIQQIKKTVALCYPQIWKMRFIFKKINKRFGNTLVSMENLIFSNLQINYKLACVTLETNSSLKNSQLQMLPTVTKVRCITISFIMSIFFPIANLKIISWCNVIQQIKMCGLTKEKKRLFFYNNQIILNNDATTVTNDLRLQRPPSSPSYLTRGLTVSGKQSFVSDFITDFTTQYHFGFHCGFHCNWPDFTEIHWIPYLPQNRV